MNAVPISGIDVYRWYVLPAVGELIGTALFVLFVNLSSAPSTVRSISYPLMSGASLFLIRGFFSRVTPGHYNPVVSISQLVMRRLDAPTAVTYVIVQAFGAFLGAVLYRSMVSNNIFEKSFIGSYMASEGLEISRSQGFFLDITLSAVVCFSYAIDDYSNKLQIPFCWTIVSFFSFPLIGQAGNVALSSANAIVYYIFTGDGTPTSHLYLHFSAGLVAIVVSSFIVWLLKTPVKRKRIGADSKAEHRDKSVEVHY